MSKYLQELLSSTSSDDEDDLNFPTSYIQKRVEVVQDVQVAEEPIIIHEV